MKITGNKISERENDNKVKNMKMPKGSVKERIQVKKDCGKCKYRCTPKFNIEEQKSIFQ